MPASASPDDLRALLHHHVDDAVSRLNKQVIAIKSKASGLGALGNGRLPLQYIAAGEEVWRGLVDDGLFELRRYVDATDLGADVLTLVAKEELNEALARLRGAVRWEPPSGSRFKYPDGAQEAYEAAWSKLHPYLELKLRQFELGVDKQPARESFSMITYSINAETISGPIQQGSHGSTQTVVVSAETLIAKLEQTVRNEIADEQSREELLDIVKSLQATKGSSAFLDVYQRFVSAAANHITILAPFLPALTQLISR